MDTGFTYGILFRRELRKKKGKKQGLACEAERYHCWHFSNLLYTLLTNDTFTLPDLSKDEDRWLAHLNDWKTKKTLRIEEYCLLNFIVAILLKILKLKKNLTSH